jgi:hypothetical protein
MPQPHFEIVPHDPGGYVIVAKWPDGKQETLAGLYVLQENAQDWLDGGGGRRWFAQLQIAPHVD